MFHRCSWSFNLWNLKHLQTFQTSIYYKLEYCFRFFCVNPDSMTFGSSASVDSYVLGLRAVALGFKRPTKNLLVKGNTDQNRWFSRVSWAMWFVAGKKGSYETSESTIIFLEDQAGVVICLNVGLYFLTLAQPKRCLHRLCRFSGRLLRFVRRLLGGWKSEMGLSALIGSPPQVPSSELHDCTSSSHMLGIFMVLRRFSYKLQ